MILSFGFINLSIREMEDKRTYQKKGQERMNREKLNEQLFDVFLAETLRQIEEEELQKSEKLFEEHKMEDYVPSKRFARKIKRTYRMYVIKRYLSSRTIRRASSILLIVGMISGSLIFLAEANGFSLYETIFLREERYTSIQTYKQIIAEDHEESMEYFYFPKYIPVGFEVMEEISNDMTYYIRFEKEDLYFCISQRLNSENRTFCIDTEDSVIINIEFDGKKGFYSEKKGKQSIYLNTGRISINIYGNIGKKELFRMAKNLELLKK